MDVIGAKYYDKKEKEWLDTAFYYDVDKSALILLTHHLTEFRMVPSTDQEKDALMKKLPTPQLMYAEKYGLYARGTSIEELENVQ